MARSYQLSPGVTVNGGLLVQEIQTAHGIDISKSYEFVPPSTVLIEGFDGIDLSATVAAHAPPPPAPAHYITKEAYRLRFTADERKEIELSEDANVIELRQALWAHDGLVNLLSDRVKHGVNYLETTALRRDGVTKILAAGRAAEILAP